MALPTLTPEQRAAALGKAREARATRKQLLEDVRAGSITIVAVLDRAKDDPIVAKTKIRAVVSALPGFGQRRVSQVLSEAKIPADRRVGGLGSKQRDALIEVLH